MKIEDVTINQYAAVAELVSKSESFGLEEGIKLISILENKSVEKIENMQVVDLMQKISDYSVVLQELPERRMPVYVTIDGVRYYVTQNISEVSAGQYADMQVALSLQDISAIEKTKRVFACFLCNEKTKKYIHSIDAGNASIVDANAVMLFFYKFTNTFYKTMRRFLERKTNNLQAMAAHI